MYEHSLGHSGQLLVRAMDIFWAIQLVCTLTGNIFFAAVQGETFLSGTSGVLPCVANTDDSDQYTWTDTTGGSVVQLYRVDVNGVVESANANTNPKYKNFFVDNDFPKSVNISVNPITLQHIGTYQCNVFNIPAFARILTLDVEVIPSSVYVDTNGNGFIANESYSFTCTAVGIRSPNVLNLTWSINNAISTPVTTRTPNDNNSDLGDLSSQFTFMPQKDDTFIKCSITGYVNQEEIDEDLITDALQLDVRYTPICTLEIRNGAVGYNSCSVMLTCTCDANPEVTAGDYSYFSGNDPIDGNDDTTTADIGPETTAEFSCRGRNDVGTGDRSPGEVYRCSSLNTMSPTKPSTITNHGTSTLHSITPGNKTCGDGPNRSSTALIVICCVEGVVIVAMVFVIGFLYSSKKGWKKGDAHSFATQLQGTTDKSNSAYMDLQHTNNTSPNFVNTDVPYEELNLLDLLPGNGFINYRRAQMISTHKRTEIVVKTVSDDSPARLAALQADEVRMLSALTSNVSIVQFLGRCNKVPNLLCYEFVNGTKLGNYLKENYQSSKIHQYGNTKQKRFHVAEQGSVENLPKIALQISRGMKYLTAQKFLHPGLRSEKIIIDVSGQCKLYDFVSKDNAKDIMAIMWNKMVPYQWMPPEYLFLEKLDPSADVWSFGVVLWEIFSLGAQPYDGKARSDVERGIREKKYLSMPINCPGAIWQMTLDCWEQSPEKRPSFDHLYLQLSHMCNDNKEYDEIRST